jgi:hypothetical protein
LVAVNETVYVPDEAYEWVGFWMFEVPPSPNVQAHEVGLLDEASANWTVSGRVPVRGVPVKSATGTGGLTTI